MSNEPDAVNSGALATMIGLVALATLGTALVVTALVRNETAELSESKNLSQEHSFRKLRAEQQLALVGAPSWSDQENGLVKVSIERSMEIVVTDVSRNPFALTPSPPKPKEEEESEEIVEGEEAEGDATEADGAEDKEAAASDPVKPGSPAPKPSVNQPAPKASVAPKAPVAPKASVAPKAPVAPTASVAPKAPVAPTASVAPKAPVAPAPAKKAE
jgi:hypothetical protein